MKRISIIVVETGKKKKQSLRLKRKIRNKQRKINAYWLQNQHELRNAFLQAFTEGENRKEPELPVNIIQNKSLFNRLRAGWHWLFATV